MPMPLNNTQRQELEPPVHDARGAWSQVVNVSLPGVALSIVLAASAAGAAFFAGQVAWIALFAIFLLALLIPIGVVGAGHAVLPRSRDWNWTWGMLFVSLALSVYAVQRVHLAWGYAVSMTGLSTINLLICALVFGVLTLALPLWHSQSKMRALHLAELKQAALSAQLQALQAQVEPHFLYNTLANTRYLAGTAPEKAVQMLDHLIAYLHSALPDMRRASSTVSREFELAQHYLALMSIRFGSRLSYQVAHADGLGDLPMPPLMLMSLVENAVKHGVEPLPGEVCVRVSAEVADGTLICMVCDDGAGPAPVALGRGVGLRNLRERLAVLYGDAAGFQLRVGANGATEAELRLPLAVKPGEP